MFNAVPRKIGGICVRVCLLHMYIRASRHGKNQYHAWHHSTFYTTRLVYWKVVCKWGGWCVAGWPQGGAVINEGMDG